MTTKKKYNVVDADGQVYQADDASDLVYQMFEGRRVPANDQKDWMQQLAHRAEMCGTPISTASLEEFVEGLLNIGAIRHVTDGEKK